MSNVVGRWKTAFLAGIVKQKSTFNSTQAERGPGSLVVRYKKKKIKKNKVRQSGLEPGRLSTIRSITGRVKKTGNQAIFRMLDRRSSTHSLATSLSESVV